MPEAEPDEKSPEWVWVCNRKFKIDATLWENYKIAGDRNLKDFDTIALCSGEVGSGKTTLLAQFLEIMAWMHGQEFTLDNVAFSTDDFQNMIDSSKEYQCILYDEARRGFNITRSTSYINQTLMSKLNEIRFKRLYIGIITPRYFDLMRDLACDRSLFLVVTRLTRLWDRGWAWFYNSNSKEKLWQSKKRNMTTEATLLDVKPNFQFRFTDYFPFPQGEYNKRKEEFIRQATDKITEAKRNRLMFLLWNLTRVYAFPVADLAVMSGYTPQKISELLKAADVRFSNMPLPEQKYDLGGQRRRRPLEVKLPLEGGLKHETRQNKQEGKTFGSAEGADAGREPTATAENSQEVIKLG